MQRLGIAAAALVLFSLSACGKDKKVGDSSICPSGTAEKQTESQAGTARWCEKDGVKHGPWREQFTGGQLKLEGQYADGKMTGTWTHYHPPAKAAATDGEAGTTAKPAETTAGAEPVKERQGNYENGLKVGVWTRWHSNGKKAREATHDPTSDTVPWTTWRDDGSKWATGTIIGMRNQGEYTEWHSNGKVAAKGSYDKGEKVGQWQYFDQDGNPSSEPQGDADH